MTYQIIGRRCYSTSPNDARQLATYVKGKTGFDQGYLPKFSSNLRRRKQIPSPSLTASPPRLQEHVVPNSPQARWKRELTDRRRGYANHHLKSSEEQVQVTAVSRRTKMLSGQQERQRLLDAEISDIEKLSLPSISSTLAAEYPVLQHSRELINKARAKNFRRAESAKKALSLSRLLNLHHNVVTSVTTLERLDTMLQSTFEDLYAGHNNRSFAVAESISTRRATQETERAIFDELLGTTAGGQPGLLEITPRITKET